MLFELFIVEFFIIFRAYKKEADKCSVEFVQFGLCPKVCVITIFASILFDRLGALQSDPAFNFSI